MKYISVIYDCDICGKEHILRATWTVDTEILMKKQWDITMEGEMVAHLLDEVAQSFAKLHPGKTFNEDRLMFSQVFEESENEEKSTDKRKV